MFACVSDCQGAVGIIGLRYGGDGSVFRYMLSRQYPKFLLGKIQEIGLEKKVINGDGSVFRYVKTHQYPKFLDKIQEFE